MASPLKVPLPVEASIKPLPSGSLGLEFLSLSHREHVKIIAQVPLTNLANTVRTKVVQSSLFTSGFLLSLSFWPDFSFLFDQ